MKMKTFVQFQEDIRNRNILSRGGFDPRFDRNAKIKYTPLGSGSRSSSRFNIPDRSPTLGMDKFERTKEMMLKKRFSKLAVPSSSDANVETATEQQYYGERGGYITSPGGSKIKSFPVPGTKDPMPQILDTMPTPKERQIKNFWKKGHGQLA
jgi:hypothetical protein